MLLVGQKKIYQEHICLQQLIIYLQNIVLNIVTLYLINFFILQNYLLIMFYCLAHLKIHLLEALMNQIILI